MERERSRAPGPSALRRSGPRFSPSTNTLPICRLGLARAWPSGIHRDGSASGRRGHHSTQTASPNVMIWTERPTGRFQRVVPMPAAAEGEPEARPGEAVLEIRVRHEARRERVSRLVAVA